MAHHLHNKIWKIVIVNMTTESQRHRVATGKSIESILNESQWRLVYEYEIPSLFILCDSVSLWLRWLFST